MPVDTRNLLTMDELAADVLVAAVRNGLAREGYDVTPELVEAECTRLVRGALERSTTVA